MARVGNSANWAGNPKAAFARRPTSTSPVTCAGAHMASSATSLGREGDIRVRASAAAGHASAGGPGENACYGKLARRVERVSIGVRAFRADESDINASTRWHLKCVIRRLGQGQGGNTVFNARRLTAFFNAWSRLSALMRLKREARFGNGADGCVLSRARCFLTRRRTWAACSAAAAMVPLDVCPPIGSCSSCRPLSPVASPRDASAPIGSRTGPPRFAAHFASVLALASRPPTLRRLVANRSASDVGGRVLGRSSRSCHRDTCDAAKDSRGSGSLARGSASTRAAEGAPGVCGRTSQTEGLSTVGPAGRTASACDNDECLAEETIGIDQRRMRNRSAVMQAKTPSARRERLGKTCSRQPADASWLSSATRHNACQRLHARFHTRRTCLARPSRGGLVSHVDIPRDVDARGALAGERERRTAPTPTKTEGSGWWPRNGERELRAAAASGAEPNRVRSGKPGELAAACERRRTACRVRNALPCRSCACAVVVGRGERASRAALCEGEEE
eukprot:scaffold213147_cov22-Tisochrysis_lutea.AAC.1